MPWPLFSCLFFIIRICTNEKTVFILKPVQMLPQFIRCPLAFFFLLSIVSPTINLGIYSFRDNESFHQILWNLEATRYRFKVVQFFWNLTGVSAALLPRHLSDIRAMQWFQQPISQLPVFAKSHVKKSYRLVNKGPEEAPCIMRSKHGIRTLHLWLDVKDMGHAGPWALRCA